MRGRRCRHDLPLMIICATKEGDLGVEFAYNWTMNSSEIAQSLQIFETETDAPGSPAPF